jgi:ABC-type multidrug transport system ATPase subunit
MFRLAAVDMHTAEHLVTKCLGGELARNRTVILVTHHVTLCLPIASYLLRLDQGKVLYQGTIPELESKGVLMNIIDAEEEPFPEAEPVSDKPTNDADALPIGNGVTKPAKAGKLIEAEAIAEGKVSLKTYLIYLKAGGFSFWALTVAIQVAIRAINVVYQVRGWT